MRGLAHNRWRRRPPFGGVFAGVVLRRVWPVLLARRGVCPPHAAACVPGRLTSQSGVALGGRGHNLNCAAGGRRCAGRRRPGLVLGGRWRRRPVGWCGGCRCLLGGGVPCRWSWPPWRAVPWRANREAALGLPAWGRSAPPSRGFRCLRAAGEDRPARRAGRTC